MAVVDVVSYSCLHYRVQAGQWLKSLGLVQRSTDTWRCSAFITHRVNRVDSRNGSEL